MSIASLTPDLEPNQLGGSPEDTGIDNTAAGEPSTLDVHAEDTFSEPAALPPTEAIRTSLITRIIRHLTNEDLETNREKVYIQGNATVFHYICGLLGVNWSNIVLGSRSSKRAFFDLILIAVSFSSL